MDGVKSVRCEELNCHECQNNGKGMASSDKGFTTEDCSCRCHVVSSLKTQVRIVHGGMNPVIYIDGKFIHYSSYQVHNKTSITINFDDVVITERE